MINYLLENLILLILFIPLFACVLVISPFTNHVTYLRWVFSLICIMLLMIDHYKSNNSIVSYFASTPFFLVRWEGEDDDDDNDGNSINFNKLVLTLKNYLSKNSKVNGDKKTFIKSIIKGKFTLNNLFNYEANNTPINKIYSEPFIVENNKKVSNLKQIALICSLMTLLVSVFIWFRFDSNLTGYQCVKEVDHFNYFSLTMGIDGNSLYFILLTTFITPICLLSNWTDFGLKNLKTFLICFLLLEVLQIALFVVLDLFLFYIFFESVLIPLFIVIILFGSSNEKIRASYLLFLYTLFGSLFMLLAIVLISFYAGSTDLQLIGLYDISLEFQTWLWLAFFIAFAIKTPIWPLNTWLIKAHVEAPLAGSILLAGTILKLATYGYLRILLSIVSDATNSFLPFVQTIAIISLIYASFSTIRQDDTKAVIAYSSVAHMAVVMLGVFSNTIQGIEGSILLSLAHGFVSPALFICCGGIIYSRTHSRVILYHKGLTYYMPVFTIMFLMFTLFNTGIPLSLNFTGEIMSLMGTWFRSPLVAILGASGIVFSACYSIWLYNRISYGSFSPYLVAQTKVYLTDINKREFNLLFSLLIPTVLLGIFPNLLLNSLHNSVSSLIYL